MVGLNSHIFFVEGKKTERQFLKKLFPSKNVVIDESNDFKINIKPNIGNKSGLIVVKWINNGDVLNFINNYKSDPYSEGLSLSNYYLSNDSEIEFSGEFLLIDLDSMDRIGNSSKVDFLKESYEIISQLDNTHMLISSPMFEAFFDVDSKFVKNSELKDYKDKIGKLFDYGQNNIPIKEFDILLKKNIEKLRDYDYVSQRILCLTNFDEQNILVLSLVHHIMFEYYLIDDYENLVLRLNQDRVKITNAVYNGGYSFEISCSTDENFSINIEPKLDTIYYAPLKNKLVLCHVKYTDDALLWELDDTIIKIKLRDIIKLKN